MVSKKYNVKKLIYLERITQYEGHMQNVKGKSKGSLTQRRFMGEKSSHKCSDMARIVTGSHSFTYRPRKHALKNLEICIIKTVYITDLSAKDGPDKLSLQAKTEAFELVRAHKIFSFKVKPRTPIHDICYDLCKATSLVSIKHMLIGLEVAVQQLNINRDNILISTLSPDKNWTPNKLQ